MKLLQCRDFHNLGAIQINAAAGRLLQKLTGPLFTSRVFG